MGGKIPHLGVGHAAEREMTMRENSKLRLAVLETLWKNPLVGLAIYDGAQSTLKDANDAFLDLLDSRFRTKKTLGMPMDQCLPDFELSGLQEAFRRALATGMPVHNDAVKLNRRAGAPCTISCTLLPVAAEPGETRAAPLLLLLASERKNEVPLAAPLNLIDSHTRHGLGRRFHLSAREIDIIGECLQGKKNRQIAQDLHIGISTVKRHLESAYRKMGISSSRSLPLAILKVMQELSTPPLELNLAPARTQAA